MGMVVMMEPFGSVLLLEEEVFILLEQIPPIPTSGEFMPGVVENLSLQEE
jgi:hypothetical protein